MSESKKKKSPLTCGCLVIIVAIVIIGMIASSRNKSPDSAPQNSPEVQKNEFAPEKKVEAQPEKIEVATEAPNVTKTPTANLDSVRAAISDDMRTKYPFQERKDGDVINLKTSSGENIKGKFKKIDNSGITVLVDDKITIKVAKKNTAPQIIKDFYIDDYEAWIKEKIDIEYARVAKEALAERQKEEAKKSLQQKRAAFEKKYVSSWDGSVRPLVETIKKSMHDPSSFKHDETKLFINADNENQYLIEMKFRGKNAFGGTVLQSVSAIYELDGTLVKITENK